jgi:A/G-specific adenine glycosylase
LLKWFSQNARDLPWRKTSDPYAIWISEIMLQQTQVKTVIPFWQRWMRELPSIQKLATAKSDKILKLWEGLGYYTRARNLQKAAQIICEKHAGKFPENFDDILALPGIGRYTAGAICSIAFNQPKPILDGNVIRVLTRVFGIPKNPRDRKTNEQLWNLAEELVANSKLKIKNSKSSCSHFNQSLMELGALVCTPRQPKCVECPVKKICAARRENRVEELPNLEKRSEPTKRHFIAFLVANNNKFLVRQRPADVVNARLWEFPNIELNGDKSILEKQPFQISSDATPLFTIKHSITRYRITLDAFRATMQKPEETSWGKWLRISDLRKLAFSSAHRQILEKLSS